MSFPAAHGYENDSDRRTLRRFRRSLFYLNYFAIITLTMFSAREYAFIFSDILAETLLFLLAISLYICYIEDVLRE